MGFSPPVLSVLIINTRNLDDELSDKLGRYKLKEPEVVTDVSVPKKQNSLELLIARTQDVLTCNTNRITARDVFNQLVNELRKVDETQVNRATWFLLGALLHRYFRLIQEHADYSFGFFSPWQLKSCHLFLALRKALKLPEVKDGDYTGDLAILDSTTIVTALEAFRDNMLLKDEKQVPRYMKYPHLKQDTHFQKYLQDIIDKHKQTGLPILRQFQAINFIQSLTEEVGNEHFEVVQIPEEWNKKLIKEHSNFGSLNIESIEKHITTNITPGPIKEKIPDMLYTPHIKQDFETFNHESFLSAMKICSANTAIYTIVGGYALLLQSDGINQLKPCIEQVLGIKMTPELFDDKEKLLGINFLKTSLSPHSTAKFNCAFFGDKDKMNTFISKQEDALSESIKKVKEKKETTENNTVMLV